MHETPLSSNIRTNPRSKTFDKQDICSQKTQYFRCKNHHYTHQTFWRRSQVYDENLYTNKTMIS